MANGMASARRSGAAKDRAIQKEGLVTRPGCFECRGDRLGSRPIGKEETRREREGPIRGTPQVERELQPPTHGLNDTGGSHLLPLNVRKRDFDVGTREEGRNLELNADPISVRIRLGLDARDMRFLRRNALQSILWEEKTHAIIITTRKSARLSIPCPFSYKADRWWRVGSANGRRRVTRAASGTRA